MAALTTLPAGATVEVYAVQGDWAALGSGGTYGFAHTDALTDFALMGVTAATVKNETVAKVGSAVNVLQLPVAEAKSLANLLGGDAVRLDGYTDAWARVTTEGGVEGFIPRDALTLQGEAAGDGEIVTAPENMIALLTDDAGLYVNADDSLPPRQSLPEGGYVQVLAYNRAWAYVRTEDGLTGYVKLSGLSAVEQAEGNPPRRAPARAARSPSWRAWSIAMSAPTRCRCLRRTIPPPPCSGPSGRARRCAWARTMRSGPASAWTA